MRLEFSGQSFRKTSNIKFHENPISGSQVGPCGWMDGRTDKQFAFRYCTHAPDNACQSYPCCVSHTGCRVFSARHVQRQKKQLCIERKTKQGNRVSEHRYMKKRGLVII
jgi:hypothetical protein